MDYFFISGIINKSYILFFIIDLPINYNEFYEVAVKCYATAFVTHLKFMNFGKSQGLNIKIFHHDDYVNKGTF